MINVPTNIEVGVSYLFPGGFTVATHDNGKSVIADFGGNCDQGCQLQSAIERAKRAMSEHVDASGVVYRCMMCPHR